MKYIKTFEDRYGDDDITYPEMVKLRQSEVNHLKVGDCIEYWKNGVPFIFEIIDLMQKHMNNIYNPSEFVTIKVNPIFYLFNDEWKEIKKEAQFIDYRKNSEIPILNKELKDRIELYKSTKKYNL